MISTSCRPGCLPSPWHPRTKSPFSPLSALCIQALGAHGWHLLPSAFHQTAHSRLRLVLPPSFGRKPPAMVPLTLSIRIGYFPLEPAAPSWQTRHSNQPIPQGGHPRLPTEPCGDSALQGTEWFADGEMVGLFPLESAQVIQCHWLGWGTKGIRQRLQRAMCTVLATDSRICCYWLRPLLLGKGSLDQILFFSLGLMCKAPWVRIKRLVSGQMAGLTVRKEPGSS